MCKPQVLIIRGRTGIQLSKLTPEYDVRGPVNGMWHILVQIVLEPQQEPYEQGIFAVPEEAAYVVVDFGDPASGRKKRISYYTRKLGKLIDKIELDWFDAKIS